MYDIKEIIENITERYQSPIRLGSRCESHVYYRVEDLEPEDVIVLGQHISERVENVCQPQIPQYLISLRSYSGLAEELSRELALPGQEIEIIQMEQVHAGNGVQKKLRGATVLIVNDVITTARSCLEAHTKITMMGASILCWVAYIDRTFGPGPVPVVAAITGEPVTLLE